jgi:hypothetical protein
MQQVQRLYAENLANNSRKSGDSSKLDESTEKSEEEQKYEFMKAVLERQMKPFERKEHSLADYKSMSKMWSFDTHFNAFTSTHLSMLRSLYEDDSANKLFPKIQQFLEQKNVLLELKQSYHFSELAVQSATLLLQSSDQNQRKGQSITSLHDMKRIAYEIFQSQREQKQQQWQKKCEEYVQFLYSINQHQRVLLDELLSEIQYSRNKESVTSHYILKEDPFQNEIFVHASKISTHKDRVVLLKNRLQLWRSLYQSITTAVL